MKKKPHFFSPPSERSSNSCNSKELFFNVSLIFMWMWYPSSPLSILVTLVKSILLQTLWPRQVGSQCEFYFDKENYLNGKNRRFRNSSAITYKTKQPNDVSFVSEKTVQETNCMMRNFLVKSSSSVCVCVCVCVCVLWWA